MINATKGKAKKGSRYWIQEIINNEATRSKLDNMIAKEELQWLSPLKSADYEEFQLKHDYIISSLGVSKKDAVALFSFWPSSQPWWDALAISKDKSTLYLVEAKAHVSEMISKCQAGEKSFKKIEKALKYVMEKYYNSNNFDAWINIYYQLANRLAYLRILNEKPLGTISKVKLVLLNFANDYTYIETTMDQWEEHNQAVFEAMIGSKSAPEDVIIINYNLK